MIGVKEKSVLFLSSLIYFYCAYYLQRNDFGILISCYALLFIAYIYVIRKKDIHINNYVELFAFAVFFRLIFLFSVPALSDDFYRFIWDGRMIIDGINPYLILPSEFIQTSTSNDFRFLFENMNSPNYYTVYPPINQLFFGLASFIGNGNVYFEIIALRSFIILAEIGTMIMLPKLLQQLRLNKNLALIYLLNPLVIIELTGNLHFEAVMIFFLITAFYFVIKNHLLFSSVLWALAIGTKLIPLIFLPVLIKTIGIKKSIYHYIVTALGCILMFLPFLSNELIGNFFSSIDLYFQSFEFNASIYFIVREMGYWIKGWNTIQFIGPAMGFATFIGIISILLFYKKKSDKSFLTACYFALLLYLLMATTVHPWYLSTLILFGLFTKYKWIAIAWSFLVILSYGAYSGEEHSQNLIFVALEYTFLLGISVWILFDKKIKQIVN